MPGERRRGMDHTLYGYVPIVDRPALRWPGGAHVALWVVVHLEYWELDPPSGAHRPPGIHGHWGTYFPDYRTHSHREYGNRIGIFRLMEVLDRYGIRATVAANAAVCDRYPFLVQECVRRGWEVMAHGTHATRMLTSRTTEAEERAVIRASVEAVERAAGRRPRGWLGQDFGESDRTPRLVAEAGLEYLSDWANDEQPYPMTVGKPLVSIPYQAEWDDVQLLWLRQLATPRYATIVQEAFERLHADGARSGRVLGLGVHAWLLGQAHRIRYLDEALARISRRDGVWKATGAEIARSFLARA